jgi:hypothetical protein
MTLYLRVSKEMLPQFMTISLWWYATTNGLLASLHRNPAKIAWYSFMEATK